MLNPESKRTTRRIDGTIKHVTGGIVTNQIATEHLKETIAGMLNQTHIAQVQLHIGWCSVRLREHEGKSDAVLAHGLTPYLHIVLC